MENNYIIYLIQHYIILCNGEQIQESKAGILVTKLPRAADVNSTVKVYIAGAGMVRSVSANRNRAG